MKIGILTHYSVYNQGAQLQMYAMKHWLEEHGHQVIILTYEKNFDFNKSEASKNSASVGAIGYYIKNYLLDKGFGLTVFNTRKVMALKKAFQNVETAPYDHSGCDAIIIGSDEVFSIDVGCNKMMYGCGLGNVPAIAYAPAFGRTTEELLKEFNCYEIVQKGLQNMYALSARDLHTQQMIDSMTGRKVPMVCDPVILYSGKKFFTKVKPIRKKYLLVYAYDCNMTNPNEIREIKSYAKKHKLLTVSVGTYHKWCDKNIVCNAEEWYSYFREASCVVTDTFHGSVVAIKNHCNVAVFIRESINAFKLESLLKTTGLEDRRLTDITEQNLERILQKNIDYQMVDKKLDKLIEHSENYLKTSLENINVQ
ncbi:MAG: polysaccharide pyruvyl transferase family protein [Ruminococcus sp.]|nr:polysaccharide pyruvyl transferase family protein [Ruminococcus sp.]